MNTAKIIHNNLIQTVIRVLYPIYRWLVYAPFLVLSTVILGALAVLLTLLTNPRLAGQVAAVTWARLNAFVTPMPVTVLGRENIDLKQSYVIVANHQSLFDIFVVYGWLDIDFRWVIKKELRKVPVLGYCCEVLEHVFVDRTNTEAAVASLNAAKERLVDGTSILFFPEGTRSKTGDLLPFKKGAFRMGQDLQLPILPVSIVGTRKVLPSGTTTLYPGRAKLVIHPPISTDGATLLSLSKQSRKLIASALEEGAVK